MIRVDIKRKGFFKELENNKDKQKQFFHCKAQKFLPNIDNIYYTVRLKDDYNRNPNIEPIFEVINRMKEEIGNEKKVINFCNGLNVDYKTFKLYKYCLTCEDLFDVFIMDYLPNNNTPRIVVQIRSSGIWTTSYEEMLNKSFMITKEMLLKYGLEIERVCENRIDYCYHTNAIQNPDKVLSEQNLETSLRTTFNIGYSVFRITSNDNKNKFIKDYLALGARKSNNLFIRLYNKASEVIEQGYKNYFIKIWFENGLINYYDKFCFEYAYNNKNFDYIYKAQLEFYIIHGNNENRKTEYRNALNNNNNTLDDYKKLASLYMPQNTTIFNIEFETKRKFYYSADSLIDSLDVSEKANICDIRLNRIFKVIHNRGIFLDYLTSKTLSFVDSKGDYADWWKRLRMVKMKDLVKSDTKLLRDYSNNLDSELLQRKFINLVTSLSVYSTREHSDGFVGDTLSALSNINDNDKLSYSLYKYDDNRATKLDKLKNRL